MTQETFCFDPPKRQRKPSLTDKLEQFLSARVGQWVSVMDMAAVVGHSGVRERRRECEKYRGVQIRHPGEYRGGAYGFVILGYVPAATGQREAA